MLVEPQKSLNIHWQNRLQYSQLEPLRIMLLPNIIVVHYNYHTNIYFVNRDRYVFPESYNGFLFQCNSCWQRPCVSYAPRQQQQMVVLQLSVCFIDGNSVVLVSTYGTV